MYCSIFSGCMRREIQYYLGSLYPGAHGGESPDTCTRGWVDAARDANTRAGARLGYDRPPAVCRSLRVVGVRSPRRIQFRVVAPRQQHSACHPAHCRTSLEQGFVEQYRAGWLLESRRLHREPVLPVKLHLVRFLSAASQPQPCRPPRLPRPNPPLRGACRRTDLLQCRPSCRRLRDTPRQPQRSVQLRGLRRYTSIQMRT